MSSASTQRIVCHLFGALAGFALAGSTALAETAAATKSLTGVNVSISLDQGEVDVKSTQGPLGLYREKIRKQEAQDFNAFKQQITDGMRKEQEAFEKYKDQVTREFIGYVESVTLKPGTELSISGNTAIERKAGAQDNAARDFMKRWRTDGDANKAPGGMR